MRDKAVFAGGAVLAMSLLFGVLWWLSARTSLIPTTIGTSVPVIAVIVAARGVRWARKLGFCAALVGALVLLQMIATTTGWGDPASVPSRIALATLPAIAADMLYALAPSLVPLAGLVLFVGRSPQVLWTPVSARSRRARRTR